MEPHAYLSTGCAHGECAACRLSCKFCDALCQHECHADQPGTSPEPWVDQARNIARELYQAASAIPPELERRIWADPALFWLRGEETPPGERARIIRINTDPARDQP